VDKIRIFAVLKQRLLQRRKLKSVFVFLILIVAVLLPARRYASAVLVVLVCPYIYLSVRLSQAVVLLRWLKLWSRKQHHTIAHGLEISDGKNLGEIPTGSTHRGRQIEVT